MDVIDVRGIPDPVAHALQAIVQTLREQLQKTEEPKQRRPKVTLPVRHGNVIGTLTREELYDDVV